MILAHQELHLHLEHQQSHQDLKHQLDQEPQRGDLEDLKHQSGQVLRQTHL